MPARDDIVRVKIKAWLTDHVLTKGVREVEAWFTSYLPLELRVRKWTRQGMVTTVYQHPDWHRTHSEALLYAEKVRKKKIDNMRERIAILEKLTF